LGFLKRIESIFDTLFRDLLVFGGLFSLSYGSYLIRPHIGFIVLGAVSMLLGLGWLIRRPKK